VQIDKSMMHWCSFFFLHIPKIETYNKREIGVHVKPTMFSLLYALQCDDDLQLANTLHSFHLIQAAVRKEECDGYRRSVPVLSCF
jgi:hypothetical protein